jgi:hypothetical protein
LSPDAVKSIAYAVPTTFEELFDLGLLSERKLEEYGGRLVRQIEKFVKDESLKEYVYVNPYCPVLSDEYTKKLVECIKNLTVIWAQEEGNNVSCKFHVMI